MLAIYTEHTLNGIRNKAQKGFGKQKKQKLEHSRHTLNLRLYFRVLRSVSKRE